MNPGKETIERRALVWAVGSGRECGQQKITCPALTCGIPRLVNWHHVTQQRLFARPNNT